MKIYLAGRYSRRLELLKYSEELNEIGYEVTSRWIRGDHETDDDMLSFEEGCRFAKEDLEDIAAADVLIAFTENPEDDVKGSSRGGRHVELGYALAAGKRVIVVGHWENVFCHLSSIVFYSDYQDLLRDLCAVKRFAGEKMLVLKRSVV